MSSTIKIITALLAVVTLGGCGGGGGTGSAQITTITVDHFSGLSTTPITGATNIKSTAQTSPTTSVSLPQANQIRLGTTTYTFANSMARGGIVNQSGTLAVASTDTLNLGYSHARITTIVRGSGLNTSPTQVNEVLFVQTSENPTAVNNLPTQASVRYTGQLTCYNFSKYRIIY